VGLFNADLHTEKYALLCHILDPNRTSTSTTFAFYLLLSLLCCTALASVPLFENPQTDSLFSACRYKLEMAAESGDIRPDQLYELAEPDAANTLGGMLDDTEPDHPSVIGHMGESSLSVCSLTPVATSERRCTLDFCDLRVVLWWRRGVVLRNIRERALD
jgi:hypothetical protein